jgi:UDP-N-acetylmuramoyl-L-alanyl-D-glutamate--2,6-diaminopimelate ligase
MAGIAARFSNRLILTSDNPRNEDPKAIIHEMALGLDPVQKNKVLEIEDRRQAIKLAVSLANAGDIILVAGKGHEKYQEIQGVKYPFDDLEEIKNQFKERA